MAYKLTETEDQYHYQTEIYDLSEGEDETKLRDAFTITYTLNLDIAEMAREGWKVHTLTLLTPLSVLILFERRQPNP